MATTWMARRLGRQDPSSSRPRPPEVLPPSPTHERVLRVLTMVQRAAEEKAGEIPGGGAMAKLMLGRARGYVLSQGEEDLRRYLQLAGAVAGTVLTGEGFDQLEAAMLNEETGDDGGTDSPES